MTSSIIQFQFGFSDVRIVLVDGEPWLVAKDVCDVLGLSDVFKACERLDSDEKGTNTIRTLGGDQDMIVISESGFYRLVMTSRKPEVRKFQKWVTSTVIPSIRKTGSYSIAPEIQVPIENPRQLPQVRDSLDYAHAMPIINALTNTRLKELLLNKMTDELSLLENQKQLPTKTTRYTIAKVRATELGYSLSQIGSGSALGTHIGKQVDRVALGAFQEGIGNYVPWHYPVCIDLDMAIHSYFRIKGLEPENEQKVLCNYR